MIRVVKSLIAAVLLGLAAEAVLAADSAADCVAIEDPTERLACFDRQFEESPVEKDPVEQDPPEQRAATVEEAAAETAPQIVDEAVTPAAVAAESAEPKQRAEVPAESTTASDTSTESARSGWFGDEKVDMDATIADVYHREQQKMVFLLDNEQVWMQSSPRLLRIREGDRVNIRNASVGGYLLRTEGGVTTRVERIR